MNPFVTRLLIFLTRIRIPIIAKIYQIILNCDIGCRLPRSTKIGHPFGIIIHASSMIGENVTILQQVTLGCQNDATEAPIICDDVYIGAGAKILGRIKVGRGVCVGANAVVLSDVPDNAVAVGVPARIIIK